MNFIIIVLISVLFSTPIRAQVSYVSELFDLYQPLFAQSEIYHERREAFRTDLDSFEAGPVADLLAHTDPELTLIEILGADVYEGLSADGRSALSHALRESFRRYTYEWLEDDGTGIGELVGVAQGESVTRAVLKIRRSVILAPDLVFNVYVAKTSKGWKAYDFGFWGVRYSGLKRATYKYHLDNYSEAGLVQYLLEKNRIFFQKLCENHIAGGNHATCASD